MLLTRVPTAVDHAQNPEECIQQQQPRLACVCQGGLGRLVFYLRLVFLCLSFSQLKPFSFIVWHTCLLIWKRKFCEAIFKGVFIYVGSYMWQTSVLYREEEQDSELIRKL